jgi:hypothetical protein
MANEPTCRVCGWKLPEDAVNYTCSKECARVNKILTALEDLNKTIHNRPTG